MARSPDFEGEQSKVTSILRAIGNTKRLRILNELSDGHERSVSALENIIATLSQSALSQHLGRLRRANIVRTRRESQTIYYSIDDHDVLRILRLLSHIYEDDPVMRRTRHQPNFGADLSYLFFTKRRNSMILQLYRCFTYPCVKSFCALDRPN